jgi:uncharacterized protein YcaQ
LNLFGKEKMKRFIVMVAGVAASLFLSAAASADTSVSNLKQQVADAQKQVDQAQAQFDQAKEKAESGMSSSGKAEWRQAETKLESLMANGKVPEKISTQKDAVKEIESRVMKSSDREDVEDARNDLAKAQFRLDQAKTRMNVAKQKVNNDDSSQFTQPENRTQNGSNFSIRSQRDSENHPPLPASQ